MEAEKMSEHWRCPICGSNRVRRIRFLPGPRWLMRCDRGHRYYA